MFEAIVEVWEVDEDDANVLLRCGWKILEIVQRMKSVSEEGWIHSKFVGVGSEIVYVMGRTEQLSGRKVSDISGLPCETVSVYEKRVRSLK